MDILIAFITGAIVSFGIHYGIKCEDPHKEPEIDPRILILRNQIENVRKRSERISDLNKYYSDLKK